MVSVVRATENTTSVVVYEDIKEDANRLIRELQKWDLHCLPSQTLDDLRAKASNLTRAMFAIDIDMGPNRHEEGLEAIKELRALAEETNRRFFILALTSHENFRMDASRAGADAFIVKKSSETDALELVTRLHVYAIEVEKKLAYEPQTKLAAREYKELEKQLKRAAKRWMYGEGFSSAMDTVHRALDWPFLLPNEQLILSTLDQQLRCAQTEGRLDRAILRLCLEGVALLADNRAEDEQRVSDWIERARQRSPEFLFHWLDEEDFDLESDSE